MDENEVLKDSIKKIANEKRQNNLEKLQDSLPKSKEIIDNPMELDTEPDNLTTIETGERSSIVQNNEDIYFLQNNTTKEVFYPATELNDIINKWFENNAE